LPACAYGRLMSLSSTALRLWIASPALEPGEVLEHRAFANTYRGTRSVGGQVTVTDRRVIYVPTRVDSITGVSRQDIVRSHITEVADASVAGTIYPSVALQHPGGTLTMTVRDVQALKNALA
jgi:hypothetical protein